jgi:hypothetical protein
VTGSRHWLAQDADQLLKIGTSMLAQIVTPDWRDLSRFVLASDPGSLVYGLPQWLQTVFIVALAVGLILILIYIYGVGSGSLEANDEGSQRVQSEKTNSLKACTDCVPVVYHPGLFPNMSQLDLRCYLYTS